MDANEDFKEYVDELNSSKCLDDADEAKKTIKAINKSFAAELSQFSTQLFTASLLDEQNGITAFIRRAASNHQHKDSLPEAFKLLQYLIVSYEDYIEPYFHLLIDTCLYVFKNGKLAKFKENSLILLKIIIETPVNRDLDIDKVIEDLKTYLKVEKKISSTVQEQIYSILGSIFQFYPQLVDNSKDWFFGKVTNSLHKEVFDSKSLSASVINGCFEALIGLLSAFPALNDEKLAEIYQIVRKCSDVDFNKQQRRVANRSSLKVFEKHSRLFGNYIYRDHEFWQNKLGKWIEQKNKEDRDAGLTAIFEFYRRMARTIQDGDEEDRRDVYKKFLRLFSDIIKRNRHTSNPFEIRYAVFGIGEFSSVTPFSEEEKENLFDVFQEIIKHSQNSPAEKISSYLPLCLESISKFVSKMSSVKIEELNYLRQLSIFVIEQYPKIDSDFQCYSLEALEKSFYHLSACGLQVLNDHVNDVVYQGLIRSCAHAIWMDVELQKQVLLQKGENPNNLISYKSYLSLWQYLLNLSNSKLQFNKKDVISAKIFDAYVTACLKIVQKLDLEITQKNALLSDPELAMEARNHKDHQILINVVDLYQEVLPATDSSFLTKWFVKIFHEVIDLSYKNPFVSGLYKIIGQTLTAADDRKFFEEDLNDEKRVCINSLVKFLETILKKVDQYKGDLQIACLQTLLSAPVRLTETFVERTVPVFEVVLRVGRGYFPLLKQCIGTLERWNAQLPASTMRIILEKILPRFDLFLQSKGFRDAKFEKLPDDLRFSKSRGRIKKKTMMDPNDSQLLMLQRRFLLFLGKLNPDLTEKLARTEEIENENVTDKHLTYQVPFNDMKPQIHLDEILPRIIDLSLSCGDRNTRFTACELLHSIIMIALGNMKQTEDLIGYFKQLLRTCLALGCDADSVIRQLFNPLLLQITRYFSGKQRMASNESAALIEILMENVAHPYHSEIRDLAARSIREFVKWAIKHLTPEELKKTPSNVKAILRNVYSFSLHPSFNKRLGAAVTFNNIYGVIREERFVLEAYWFELYYHFLESLKMYSEFEDKIQVINSIAHLERPLTEMSQIFNKESTDRRKPPGFEGSLLCHLLKWTLNQCTDVRKSSRETAMNLVVKLSPKVKDCDSLRRFIELYLNGDIPVIEPISLNDRSEEGFLDWLNYYQSLFDYYNWLLKNKAVDKIIEKYGMINTIKKFVTEIKSQRFQSSQINSAKSEIAILILEISSNADQSDLFDDVMWGFVTACIFQPCELGFELKDKDHLNALKDSLVSLIKSANSGLNSRDWDYFQGYCSNLTLPDFTKILRSGEIEVADYEFLYGLKITKESGIWDRLNATIRNQLNGILDVVFNSLFTKQMKKEYAVAVNPTAESFGEELLKLALSLNPDVNLIMTYITDREEVTDRETYEKTTKGEYFLLTYKTSLYQFLIDNYDKTIDLVFNDGDKKSVQLAITILQHVYYNKTAENRKSMINKIFSNWQKFEALDLGEDRNRLLFSLVKNACLLSSVVGCLKLNQGITDWIFGILKKSRIELNEIEWVFTLIAYLCDHGEDLNDNEFLYKSLLIFWKQHKFFRVEFLTSAERYTLKFMYDKLFSCFEETGSLMILKFIIKVAPRHFDYVNADQLNRALRVFAVKMSPSHLQKCLKFLYGICFSSPSEAETILVASKQFLDELLRNATSRDLLDFLLERLEDVKSVIVKPFEEKILNESRIEIARKISALLLIQTLYLKTTRDEIPQEKRSILQAIIGHCSSMRDQTACERNEILSLFLKYKCTCFNTLATILQTRARNSKAFAEFIFKEGNSIWRKIVDNEKEFNLSMEFDESPKYKKVLTSLRKTVTAERQRKSGETIDSIKYMQSRTLFESSLQEDVTKFDFTGSMMRSTDSVPKTEEIATRSEVQLEIDSLNDHECMATVVGLILFMISQNFTPLPVETNDSTSNVELPCWLTSLLFTLEQKNVPENTKLFVLKILHNLDNENCLKPYAHAIFPKVLKVVTQMITEKAINYFVIDLIIMLLNWKLIAIDDEMVKIQLTMLVEKLITKSDAFQKRVISNNLEVIKTSIEVWKDCLITKQLTNVAYSRLTDQSGEETASASKSKPVVEPFGGVVAKNYLNLHLIGILIANGIPAWTENEEFPFLRRIFQIYKHGDKTTKGLACELFGSVLNFLRNRPNFEEYRNYTVESIKDILAKQDIKKEGKDISILYGVHKSYPDILPQFAQTITMNAWKKGGASKTQSLEMLLSFVSKSESSENDPEFPLMFDKFLLDMLASNNVDVQKLTLRVISSLADKLADEKLVGLYREAVKLSDCRYPDVRNWVYEIAMKSYDKYDDDLFEDPGITELRRQCKIVLLKGLTDGDQSLEEKCLKFWCEKQMRPNAGERIFFVFRELYTPETESGFLTYATRLLLEASNSSPEYKEAIFRHPIHECTFESYKIMAGIQHSTIAPMFAQTLASRVSRDSLESLTDDPNDVRLRETAQSLMFRPTVTDSVQEGTFLSEAVPSTSKSTDEEFKAPKRKYPRISKNSEKMSHFFAMREKERKKEMAEKDKERRKKRETNIETYRNYRRGDYPDIQIPHSELLKPLEVLTRKDPQIARQFLVSLFKGMIDSFTMNDPIRANSLLETTNECIDKVFQNSVNFDSAFFAFVFQIILIYGKKFHINSDYIATVSKASGWLSLGTLLMEQIIINEEAVETPVKKARGAIEPEEKKWLQLAELYHSLKEFDVLRGIFLDKLSVNDAVYEAVHCEAVLDWSAASKCYETVIRSDPPSYHSDFYSQSYFSCLANLSDWKKINDCIRGTIDDKIGDLWTDVRYRDKFLPWFLRSEMMNSLKSPNDRFKILVRESSDNKEKYSILTNRFCEELAVNDYLWGKFQKANYHVDQLYLQFLSNWSNLNRWSENLRITKLSSLQLMTEIQEMISIAEERSPIDLEDRLKNAALIWEKNHPRSQNDLLIWDVKLTYRQELLKHLDRRDLDFLIDAKKSIVRSELQLVKSAIDQDNFYLARNYLEASNKKLDGIKDHDLRSEYQHYVHCCGILKAKQSMIDVNAGIKEYVRAWFEITKSLGSQMDTDGENAGNFTFRTNLTLGELIGKIIPYVGNDQIEAGTIERIAVQLDMDIHESRRDVKDKLKLTGLGYLQNARNLIEKDEINVSAEEKSKTYLILAKYYRKFMEDSQSEELVRYVLRSMRLGNDEARRLFCCVLVTTDVANNVRLRNECDAVPTWMFLIWTNQILASLDTQMYPFIRGIILRVAKEYPNAIRYGFRLSKEKYKFQDVENAQEFRNFVEELNDLLTDPLHEKFLKAVNYLGPPFLILKYYLEKLIRAVDETEAKKTYRRMFEHLYDNDDVERGPVFEKYLKAYRKDLENISKTALDEWREPLLKIYDDVCNAANENRRTPNNLKDYSPWLADFRSAKHSSSIEIPGQYDGSRKPLLKYHVTIASFKYDLTVLRSKTKPLKMTVLGNDASEHKFLVKFGEDLRQDQRIEQFFDHVNYSLSGNKQTKKFSIDTYKVIPISGSLGIIQWIDDTSSLGELIARSLGNEAQNQIQAVREMQVKHLCQGTKFDGYVKCYEAAYQRMKRNDAVNKFNGLAHQFDRDLLRKSFWSLSTSPEHFAFLRSNFAVTSAVAFVAHWLVGIGDRHLQNTLISRKTGRVLGIDFGCAFGFATQFLNPPELIPFRLTPQIVNFMKPLNESGWIKQTMIHCLRNLRKEPSVLLAVLEVFALEPSMDWLEQARKERMKRSRENGADIGVWYPDKKLKMVKEKLEGANPLVAFRNDLESGHSGTENYPKYLEVLNGDREFNVRAKYGDKDLTEEQQVDCLIDLSTDPHVLMKTYAGWTPWL